MLRHLRPALLALLPVLMTLPGAALAGSVAEIARGLDLPRLYTLLVREGERYGAELEADLFPGAGGARWASVIQHIHDPDRIERLVTARLDQALAGQSAAATAISDYFATDPGRQIVELELSAREALLDDEVTDAATASHAAMVTAGDPRLAQIDRLVAANDLIEQNVAGAMNSNLAFYRGMAAGGAEAAVLPEADLMAELWSQEPVYRADTTEWLMSYMVLAYGPLSDADLDSYIAFSLTPAGQLLNRALFAAFNTVYDQISYEIGLAAAQILQGQDL